MGGPRCGVLLRRRHVLRRRRERSERQTLSRRRSLLPLFRHPVRPPESVEADDGGNHDPAEPPQDRVLSNRVATAFRSCGQLIIILQNVTISRFSAHKANQYVILPTRNGGTDGNPSRGIVPECRFGKAIAVLECNIDFGSLSSASGIELGIPLRHEKSSSKKSTKA
mmetsp:Transcript_20515/g.48252  ORF Transcript_20515/g.48252 Transcript_20515/m.48252 type:complete len:167 (+) Transcript_20515:590-1090(+)